MSGGKGKNKKNKNGGMSGGKSGAGGKANERPADAIEDPWRLKAKLQQGEIIGSYFKRGLPPAGKAAKRFSTDVAKARQQAQDAMTEHGIPAEYRKLVKKYFDSLQKLYKPDTKKEK